MPDKIEERLDLVNALHHAVTQVVDELGKHGSRLDEIEKDLLTVHVLLGQMAGRLASVREQMPQRAGPS